MAGRRPLPRGSGIIVDVGLIVLAALAVVCGIAASAFFGGDIGPAAAGVLAVLLGAAAVRSTYIELLWTRHDAAVYRARQASRFRETMTRTHVRHLAYVTGASAELRSRDTLIRELSGRLELTESRAVEAETRVSHEARRAREAQERLAAVLDEVLGTDHVEPQVPEAVSPPVRLRAVVDLLHWERAQAAAPAVGDVN